MFCTSCGIKNQDESNFCSSCGASLKNITITSAITEKAKSSEPIQEDLIFTVNPELNYLVESFTRIFLSLILFICAIGIYIAIISPTSKPSGWGIFCCFYLSFGIPFLHMYLKYVTYKNKTYSVFNTHIEYYDGFLVRQKRMINYINIIEIEYVQGLLQRINNSGHMQIRMDTRSMQPETITLYDIVNVADVHKQMQDVLRKHRA